MDVFLITIISVLFTAVLAAVMLRRNRPALIVATALAATCSYFLYAQISDDFTVEGRLKLNFYGTLYTIDSDDSELKDLGNQAARKGPLEAFIEKRDAYRRKTISHSEET